MFNLVSNLYQRHAEQAEDRPISQRYVIIEWIITSLLNELLRHYWMNYYVIIEWIITSLLNELLRHYWMNYYVIIEWIITSLLNELF